MPRSPIKTTPARGRSRSRKPVSHAQPETSKATVDLVTRVAHRLKESASMRLDQSTRNVYALRNVKAFSSIVLFTLAIYLVARCPTVRVSQILGFPVITKESAPFGVAHQKLFRRTDLAVILAFFISASALGDALIAFYGWYDFACFQSTFLTKKRNWIGATACTVSSFFLSLILCNIVGIYDMHHQFLSASLTSMSVLLMHICEFYHEAKPTEDGKEIMCWLNTSQYVMRILGMSTPACYLMTAHKVMPLWVWTITLTVGTAMIIYDWTSCIYRQKKCDYYRKEICNTYTTLVMSIIVGTSVLVGLSY